GRFQHDASGVGELDPAAKTAEQLDPEPPLHVLDALGQRWLADLEPLGCPAEMQLLRHGNEVVQLAQTDPVGVHCSLCALVGVLEGYPLFAAVGIPAGAIDKPVPRFRSS